MSPLAVSRLLLVFDYMVHLLSGEISHFKKLLEQVRVCVCVRVCMCVCVHACVCTCALCTTSPFTFYLHIIIKVDKNIFKRTQATLQSSTSTVPDHFSSPLEANYRAVLSKVCTKKSTEDDSNKKQKNKKTEQKPSVIDGKYLIIEMYMLKYSQARLA